ncbi:MAG: hypothetical protein AAFQ10_03360 [Pseudomonadota bacterium]
MFEDYYVHFDAQARLAILKSLAEQTDGRLNDALLKDILVEFGMNKSRDYIRTQLIWLRDQGAAVTLKQVGTVMVATLTEQGADHVSRVSIISGVARPSLKRA